ncbi:hypothetical protein Sango_0103600 [Sesamum angolense]|uniref:Reverse transcriptase domain-containing protein n=1 Tax=Sesamum angolense TaxID=2727404 RepID=A0AAE1XE93_9LAMI|nr:hypothetical protein Sango_0103600 [Sesamum angolense]
MDSEHLEDGLTDEDRRSLCIMPTLEEEIISEDVFGAVTEFFRGVEMPEGFTATTISLIPKTASPTCWSEYWPISLCNVTNKICMKLMTIRLGHLLPKVISLSQSGFVPVRLLSDNVLLAQELVHSLESRRPDANVVFKLDMAKAYDRVSWEFLYQVLRRKGFPQRWIGLVANAISHCWFSVLVNGLGNDESLPWREAGLDLKCVAGYSVASASAEGGLGVRSLANYVRAFSMKLWWLFRGSISFWHDNWLGEKPLAQLLHRDTYTMESVSYYWHEGDWNVPRILRTIPMPFAQTICQIPIAAGQGDKIVWMRIPVDARMRQKGFSFPSKCQCCEADETVSHLFIESGSAGRVAALCCHFLGSASVIRGASPICGMLRSIVGYRFRPTALFLRSSATSAHYGSSLGNPGLAVASGIIRDSAGHVHLAYQFALGTGTSVLAELVTVWRGMELALTHGLAPLVVEVDATTVISLLMSRASGKWEVQHLIMRIVCLQQVLVADVQHVFREANGASDHLAKEVASLQLTWVLHHDGVTGVLRSILCLDRQGVPHLR